jgi:hypothetical protein
MGISECVIKELPMTSCACLYMLGTELLHDEAKGLVQELLRDTGQDLRQGGGRRIRARLA